MGQVTQQEIKYDLLDQLERNGTTGKYYLDLVDDYMSLWRTKNMLIEDIDERGVSVTYKNGENQYGTKKNENVDTLIKVNLQMIKLLDALGIKPSQTVGDQDEEM
jgi:endo-alpha-1,4-polygalactosaminidase (GH114 family)